MRKLIGYLKQLQKRNKYAATVRLYDEILPLKGVIARNGFYKIDNLLEPREVAALNSCHKESSNILDADAAKSLNKVFESLNSTINQYLGRNSRIDFIQFTEVSCAKDIVNISGSWHTDNVGHRLKLFICIHSVGNIPTWYIPGTNRSAYKPSALEDLRMLGWLSTGVRVEQASINYSVGDIAIFDTNGLHRGGYNASESYSSRRLLEFEIAPIDKSNALMGSCPIGPRLGAKRIYMSAGFIEEFHFPYLLDKKLLSRVSDDLYEYNIVLNDKLS